MNHRKQIIIFIILSILMTSLGFILVFPEDIGLCRQGDYACIYPRANTIGEPVYFGFMPLIPLLIFLLFFPREVFQFWKKFAVVLISIIVITIVLTPVYCYAPLGLCFDKKSVTWLLSIGFSTISAILIIIKAIFLKIHANKTNI